MLNSTKLNTLIDSADRGDWEEVSSHYMDLVREASGSRETAIVEALLPNLMIRDAGQLRAAVDRLLLQPPPDEFG